MLSSASVEKYKEEKKNNNFAKDYEEYAKEMLSNLQIQSVKIVDGDEMLPMTNPDEIANIIKEFVVMY